jgi:spore coat protein U-like protein
MKRVAQFVVIAIAVFFATHQATAGIVSANLQISVTVDSGCVVSTTPIVFSPYAPLGVNLTSPDDSNGYVTVQCTPGVVATIGLSNGQTYYNGSRNLGTGQSAVPYNLFQDSNRTLVWGNETGTVVTTAPFAGGALAYTVFGRIPAGLSPNPGQRTDTVLATVNF